MTVIVVTLNRSDCVERCLACLAGQVRPVEQVIVVDASTDLSHRLSTQAAVDAYPGPGTAVYLRNEAGYGHMTMSRNIGLEQATGGIVAFLDDDSFARPTWAQQLMDTYTRRREIGGVGGRAVRHERQLGEPINPNQTKIGVLRWDGMIGGAWAVDCGRELDVEHLQGCNMSFRREVLAELGGLRDEYPGPEVREETDLCLRVRRLGYRLVYNPKAVVVHVGAVKPQGQRFDCKYEYYSRRNHTYLLLRNFGFSGIVLRYLLSSCGMDARLYAAQVYRKRGRDVPAALWGMAVTQVGKLVGLWRGGLKRLASGLDPVRRDAIGRRLSQLMEQREGGSTGASFASSKGTSAETPVLVKSSSQ